MIHRSPIVSVISCARAGLALRSQRRGVIPFVLLLNLAGQYSAKSRKTYVPEKVAMQLRHSVDRAGSDNGQVRHADMFLSVLLDNAHPAQAVSVEG